MRKQLGAAFDEIDKKHQGILDWDDIKHVVMGSGDEPMTDAEVKWR